MEERLYDLIFITRPDTPEEEISKLVATLEQAATAATERGGKVEKVEKWGTRKLAYRVHKHREGFYVYLVLRATQGEMIKELERRLKVSDPVIKYLTVRLDEELKRQQKLGRGSQLTEPTEEGENHGRRTEATLIRTAGRAPRRASRWASQGQATVFSQEEGVPLLRRAGGLHRLQEGGDAAAVRAGPRQDPAAAHDRHLLEAPALAG